MDFFEHQEHARKKTKLLVFFFVLAVILIITAINATTFVLGNQFGEFNLTVEQWFKSRWFLFITVGTIFVILIGSLIRGLQISGGGKSVAKMAGATPVNMDSSDPLERRYINVVEEMSIASGISVPSLYIMQKEAGMNAFVAGLVPSDTVMVVTRGLLDNLNRHELQGVVAHEFSHIFNSDMRLNLRLITILGGILALGQMGYFMLRSLRYSSHRSSSSKSNNNIGLAIMGSAVALLVVGYIGLFFGRLIKASISRQREFLADASAVQFSRDSMGIANALYKIKTNGKGSLLDSSHAEDMSHMCFGSALNFTFFSGLLATHPPLDVRIKTLVPRYKPEMLVDVQPNSDNAPTEYSQNYNQNPDSLHSNLTGDNENTVDSTSSGITSSGFNNTTLSDTQKSFNASDVIHSIGTVNPEQLQRAKQIFHSIPTQLINALHNPKDSQNCIYGMIIVNTLKLNHSNSATSDSILQTLDNRISNKDRSAINGFVELISPLGEFHYLPMIGVSIPVLKTLEFEERKQFLANVSLLIAADKNINPFEFFLYAVLRKNLTEKDASFNDQIIKKYKPLLAEIEYVSIILAKASGQNDHQIVSSSMKTFDKDWQLSGTDAEYDAKRLNSVLLKLNQLTPMLKKPLMQSFADIVEQDGIVNHTEMELLRSIGIYLDCPIPLLNK